jgi:hypothetical protein
VHHAPSEGGKSPITGLPHKSIPTQPSQQQPDHASHEQASSGHASRHAAPVDSEEEEIRKEMADLDAKMKHHEALSSSSSKGSSSLGAGGTFIPATSSLIMITIFFAFIVCAFIGYRRWKASRASYSAVATDEDAAGSSTEMSVIVDSDQVTLPCSRFTLTFRR